MNLLSSILTTMNEKSAALIQLQDNLLLKLLIQFATERSMLVRQYVFGLFGDVHKYINDAQG